MNWPEITEELLTLENRIDQKLDNLVSNNPDSFPLDRLSKGKEMRAVCRGIRALIQLDQTDDARYLLGILKEIQNNPPK